MLWDSYIEVLEIQKKQQLRPRLYLRALQMTEDFLWSHDVICVGNYLDDGFTKSIMRVFASSPVSHMMYNNLRLSIWKPFLKRFKFAAYYDGFAMFAHEKRFISKASNRPMALAALPFGAAFCLILKLKK